LKWGALGVGGTVLALGGSVFLLVRPGATAAGRKALSADEARFLEAAAEAYFPPGNGLGLDVRALDVGGAADDILAGFPAFERTLVRGLFNGFEAWPRLTLSSTGGFAAHSLEERIEILKSFDASSLLPRRGAAEALRAFLGMAVFARPDALSSVGFVHGCERFE
jgi:hypothetical protein